MKENKSYFKSQKGITLVALIITIVLMFVLARVTVSALIGPDGIIARARESASEAEKLKIYEQISAIAADMQTDGILDTGAILKKLKKEFEVTESGVNYENGKIILDEKIVKIKGKNGEYKYFIDENEVRMTDKELAEIKEGDIVLFDSDLNGKKEEWIVLTDNITINNAYIGEEKTGYIEIVSAKIMGSLTLGVEDSWTNWEKVYDKANIDNEEGLEDIEKAIYSYNNSIYTIHEYCNNLIKAENMGVRNLASDVITASETENVVEESKYSTAEYVTPYKEYLKKLYATKEYTFTLKNGSREDKKLEKMEEGMKLLYENIQNDYFWGFDITTMFTSDFGGGWVSGVYIRISDYDSKYTFSENIHKAYIVKFNNKDGYVPSSYTLGVLPVVKLEYDG